MREARNLRAWVEIDKKSLIHNLKIFRKLLGEDAELMAVIKANAYGHGLTLVAKLLAKIKNQTNNLWFGVDSIDEGIALRRAGIKNKILILGWIPENRIKETLKNNLSFALYNFETLKKISNKPYKVHLKIETGTNRQGILIDNLQNFAKELAKSNLKIEGLYSHLADSEDINSSFWKEQLNALNKAKEILSYNFIFPRYIHIAPTAAATLYPESRLSLARIGLGLFGLWPSKALETRSRQLKADLRPVLTWKTRIAQIKKVKKDSTIGYYRTYKTKEDLIIAVLPVGYYDGYDRRLSNKGEVLIKNKKAKVLGRVCMNMIMVNVSKIPNLKVGDEVILLGGRGKERISAEEIAEKIGTINYEIVTRINPLIPRIAI